MPNGGTDNCATCEFNSAYKAKQGIQDKNVQAYCTVRNIKIKDPFWTYCNNWHTKSKEPDGPIYISGLHDEQRIPWYDNKEPKLGLPGICMVCGEPFTDGIEVRTEGNDIKQFCSNDHYIKWWNNNQ